MTINCVAMNRENQRFIEILNNLQIFCEITLHKILQIRKLTLNYFEDNTSDKLYLVLSISESILMQQGS